MNDAVDDGAEDVSKGQALNHSRELRFDRTGKSPETQDFVDTLLERLEATEQRERKRRRVDRGNLRATLEAITLEAFVTYVAEPERYLAYPKQKTWFSEQKKSRYRVLCITYQAVVDVTAFLKREGLIEDHVGYAGKFLYAAGTGRRSRLRATGRLMSLAETLGVDATMIGHRADLETVILKGAAKSRRSSKPKLPYDDTEATLKMRETLSAVNGMLSKSVLELRLPQDHDLIDEGGRIFVESDRGPAGLDLSACRLYRVFNNSSFEEGGRFYGGWWQNIRADTRIYICINDEQTVELDYAAMHPRILYAMAGVDLADVDPYTIIGLEGSGVREALKKTFNKALNASQRTGMKADKIEAAILPNSWTYQDLLDELIERHAPIADNFFTGMGLRLQKTDSDIAEKVLHYMTIRGYPTLPVHDSFITAERHKKTLHQTMLNAYHAIFGVYPVIREGDTTLPNP